MLLLWFLNVKIDRLIGSCRWAGCYSICMIAVLCLIVHVRYNGLCQFAAKGQITKNELSQDELLPGLVYLTANGCTAALQAT